MYKQAFAIIPRQIGFCTASDERLCQKASWNPSTLLLVMWGFQWFYRKQGAAIQTFL